MRIIEILLHFNHQAFLSHLCKCPVEQVAFLHHFQVQVVTMTVEHEARLLGCWVLAPTSFACGFDGRLAAKLWESWKSTRLPPCRCSTDVPLVCDFNMLHMCFFSDNCASHSYYYLTLGFIHTYIIYIHIYIFDWYIFCTLIFVYKMYLHIWQYELYTWMPTMLNITKLNITYLFNLHMYFFSHRKFNDWALRGAGCLGRGFSRAKERSSAGQGDTDVVDPHRTSLTVESTILSGSWRDNLGHGKWNMNYPSLSQHIIFIEWKKKGGDFGTCRGKDIEVFASKF